MEIDFKIRITPEEKRQELSYALLQGSAILVGVVLLALFFLPFVLLAPLVYFAFTRYREVVAQEKTPDTLRLEKEYLIFFSRNKKVYTIPLISISRLEYDKGIILYTKNGGRSYFKWFEPRVYTLLKNQLPSQ
jgi:hypothetical protein